MKQQNATYTIPILIVLILTFLFGPHTSLSQKTESNSYAKKERVFHYNQFVMIELKDGTKVPGRITSVGNQKSYYVRMIGGKRTGKVHLRYLTAMTNEEIENLKKNRTPKSR